MDDFDFAFALHLSELADKNETFSDNDCQVVVDSKKSLSVTDPSWELIDPIPDIRQLFMEFNRAYFEGKLACVEVKWSSRMTLCAGLCRYEGRGGLCCINLSQPLLKLRPRSDLVNTLLHEMIHALLFVTNNNRDRDGHGPEFHKHMYRINKQSGSNITVYHSFHDEVNEYKQHWWKCDGPCTKRRPFYGMVRRAMNRAPGPNDRWWSAHQKTCGGSFKKIREPDKPSKKNPAGKNKNMKIDGNNEVKPVKSNSKNVRDYFNKSPSKNKQIVKPTDNEGDESSVQTNRDASNSKVRGFQNINANGISEGSETFSGSSQNSSSNIHGFKMTARKTDNTSSTTTAFSGKGLKICASDKNGTLPSASFSSRESFLNKIEGDLRKIDRTNNTNEFNKGKGSEMGTTEKKGVVPSASYSSRESFLSKNEGDIRKAKGTKRGLDKTGNSENQTGNSKIEKIMKPSTNRETGKSLKRDFKNNKYDGVGVLVNNTNKSESKINSNKRKSSITDGVLDVICIDDSADDDILSAIDESFLNDSIVNKIPSENNGNHGNDNLVDCPACPARVPEHELNKHLDSCLLLS